MAVVTRMRVERIKRGLQFKDVAEHIGCSAGHIGHMELKRRSVTDENAKKLSELYEIPVHELLDEL